MHPNHQQQGQHRRERTLERLLGRLVRRLERAAQTSNRFSRWRLAIFLAGLGSSITAYRLEWYHVGNGTLALFALIFLIVAWYDSRLEDRMHRIRVWRLIKCGHLARLRLNWE